VIEVIWLAIRAVYMQYYMLNNDACQCIEWLFIVYMNNYLVRLIFYYIRLMLLIYCNA